jgi:membrane fusion protein (multidrug efflux system)
MATIDNPHPGAARVGSAAPDSMASATPPEAAPVTPQPAAPPQPTENVANPPATSSYSRRKWLILAMVSLGVVGGVYNLAPVVATMLTTVSTDDAYVNGHVTFVAPRVPGQVMRVLVDDNNRVKKGDLLVELDKEPYQVQLAIKKAAVMSAEADLIAAQAQVRSFVAQTRASRFKLDHAVENVNNQIAQLRAGVAALDSELAIRDRALKDFERAKEVAKTPGAIAPQDVDLRLQTYLVARAKVRQSVENIHQIRASLGLPQISVNADAMAVAPKQLAETPDDLPQTFSTVRQAVGDLMQSAAQFGYSSKSFDATPKQVISEFYKQDPEGNIDRILAKLIANAPHIKQAEAKLLQAQRDLQHAELNLRYCDVVSEIDGVVTRRNVNPGNCLQSGQNIMAVRSLTQIWIDANFKETQLADLRIGQRVRCEVDMYGTRREYEGRITGFTMGTGQTLALLPPQNATGNFVKIVQRLPVRIELTDYDPDKAPLFVGLSVVPYVYYKEPATGPHAGAMLQAALTPSSPGGSKP